jgi:predicted DCC family thiol-disulfide oxidoreductase YuxK
VNASGGRTRPAARYLVGVSRGPTAPVVLFDGACTLCDGAVRLLLRLDRRAVFRVAPLGSAAAGALLSALPERPAALPDSVLLVDDAGLHTRSSAALRIARRLPWPWPWLAAVAWLVPGGIRDAAYDVVARHRHRWFGRRDACRLPTPEEAGRFLS